MVDRHYFLFFSFPTVKLEDNSKIKIISSPLACNHGDKDTNNWQHCHVSKQFRKLTALALEKEEEKGRLKRAEMLLRNSLFAALHKPPCQFQQCPSLRRRGLNSSPSPRGLTHAGPGRSRLALLSPRSLRPPPTMDGGTTSFREIRVPLTRGFILMMGDFTSHSLGGAYCRWWWGGFLRFTCLSGLVYRTAPGRRHCQR